MKPLRVFTAFSGYDSQLMALERLKKVFPGFDFVCVGWSEIDRYAIAAHNALFPELKDKNFGDISKINWEEVPDFDLFTYSSPCQDFSIAGMRKGAEEGSGTRSSLLWECRKAILAKKPKYLVFENVKGLLDDRFRQYFFKWQDELARYGYANFARVLNAKDYEVPQNRERIFLVSILNYDKMFHFPKKFPQMKCLRDILEDEPQEKYFLSERLLNSFIAHTERHQALGNGFKFEPTDGSGLAHTISTLAGSRPTDNFILEQDLEDPGSSEKETKGVVVCGRVDCGDSWHSQSRGRVFDSEGISPCLTCSGERGGGANIPKILTKPVEDKYYLSDKNIETFERRNKIPNQHFMFEVKSRDDIAGTVTARCGIVGTPNNYVEDEGSTYKKEHEEDKGSGED